MMSKEIIKVILSELNRSGVRWLNGEDLTAVNGVTNTNMAIDLSEDRLEVVAHEGYFTLKFGNSQKTLDRLMQNDVLKPFIIVNEGIRLTFCVRKKSGNLGSTEIGKNIRTFFEGITNYTINDADCHVTSSSHNGDCDWRNGDETKIVERNKEIINFFYNEFKEKTFYKEWEYSKEKVRTGLNKLKSL